MTTYAITATDARRLLTPAQYAALEAGEPHDLTRADVERTWTAYASADDAAQALAADGGWIIDDDGETTWIALAEPTVTDAQIRQLRLDASDAGDLLQCAICDVATHGYVEDVDLLDSERAQVAAMTREQARAECARVIADALAQ